MEKYINKGFDTLSELTSFLNDRSIQRDKIIYVGPSNNGYMLIFVK